MRKLKIWMMLALMAAALLGGCGNGSGGTAKNDSAQEPEDSREGSTSDSNSKAGSASDTASGPDQALPDFTCTDMEGNEVSSDIFSQSKLTMVNVWATYCNPCLSEMPALGELAKQYSPEEFQVVGIISDVMEDGEEGTKELAADLIGQTKADYTHLLLNESVYKALLTDVSAVPTTFFVDENGGVLEVAVGAMEKAAWEEKINGLLGK